MTGPFEFSFLKMKKYKQKVGYFFHFRLKVLKIQ